MDLTDAQRVAAMLELQEQYRLDDVKLLCDSDPKALINEIRYFDPVTQLWVEFRMFPPEGWEGPISRSNEGSDLTFSREGAKDWFWQAQVIDWLHDPDLHAYLIYKARQLGITLLSCAYALWLMLYRPGAAAVAYSYEETEARKLVEATWAMFQSLPEALRAHVRVMTPYRELPAEYIRLKHPDGRMSTFQALPATEKHGHGARVSFGIMDEVAKQTYSRRVYEAIAPATLSRGGKLALISTADGVSNPETGEGNFFHHLYATKEEKGLSYVFLPWNAEPTRNEEWYDSVARKLPEVERNRQYPLNESDGFMLSGQLYFDREALDFYRGEVIPPLYAGSFVVQGARKAEFRKLRDGLIQVFEKPNPKSEYAICVDCASGRGTDYTSAHVIDLTTGALVAELRGKLEAARAATQLHYLGKWYCGTQSEALMCIERQGGYGDALITVLRDGNKMLPSYRRFYRHRKFTHTLKPDTEDIGFPMGPHNRESVCDGLRDWIRRRGFPWLSAGDMDELGTFVYYAKGPSPAAQVGCNDDRVMSLAMCVEMYRRYGQRPEKSSSKRWHKSQYTPSPAKAGI